MAYLWTILLTWSATTDSEQQDEQADVCSPFKNLLFFIPLKHYRISVISREVCPFKQGKHIQMFLSKPN